jgi:hypothetical protein
VFVVGGVVLEASVEDADEAVGEGAEGLVVGVAGGTVTVIERSGSRFAPERCESPSVEGVGEASVAYVAGRHDVSGA